MVPEAREEKVADRDPERSKRVTDAMMTRIQFEIAELERAYRD
jgi:hypothetical protein